MRRVCDNPPARFPERPIGEAELPWFVAHVKPRQEKAAADECLRLGIEYYLPLFTRVTRRHDNNKPRKSILPLFPGYLSFAGTPETARLLQATGRLAAVINVVQQKRFIAELGQVYCLQEKGVPLEPCGSTLFRCGDEVVIRHGPLSGVRGVIATVKNRNRLILSVEALGRAMAAVDASMVYSDKKEPVSP